VLKFWSYITGTDWVIIIIIIIVILFAQYKKSIKSYSNK